MVATYLCYRTKDTPDAVNESKFIALAVFLIAFVSIAGLPIVLSLPLDPYLSQMIIGLCFFFATMGACGFYFGQKMFYLLQGADLNAQFKIVFPNGKLADSASEKKKQLETLAQEQVDAENASDSILKKIKPEVKAAFLSSDVPSDCDVQFCVERVALWTFFRQELEKRFEQQKFNSESGGSVHDGSWADKFMNKVGRGGKSKSQASHNKSSEKDGSEHVSEVIAKMGGKGPRRESHASSCHSQMEAIEELGNGGGKGITSATTTVRSSMPASRSSMSRLDGLSVGGGREVSTSVYGNEDNTAELMEKVKQLNNYPKP